MSNLEGLNECVVNLLKRTGKIGVTFFLSCGCCSDYTTILVNNEDVENKSDEELLELFEDKTDTNLDLVKDWWQDFDKSINLDFRQKQ